MTDTRPADTVPTPPTNEDATPIIGEPSTFNAELQTDLPDGWRDDVPLLAGFEIDTFRPQGNDSMMALCTGNLNIDNVTAFYADLDNWLKEETPEMPWITEGDSRRLIYVRDAWKLRINLEQGEDGLVMRILVADQAQ